MTTPNQTILYVGDPTASAEFYAGLFGLKPAHASPEFVLFVLPDGHKFCMWTWKDPEAAMTGPGMETAVSVADYDAVDATFAAWSKARPRVLAQPETLAFGRSFVVADPDGNRIRVLAVADDPR